MATSLLSPNAKQQFLDDAGNPAAGYLLYTYAANTTTPQTTYTNRAGTVANANPIVLDPRGEATVYLTPAVVYDYVLKTPQGATVWTREDVVAQAGDAGAVLFTQTGDGAVERTTQEKLSERVSVTDFGAVGDGVTDDTAAINLAMAEIVARGGGIVHMPAGTYKVSSTIAVTASHVKFTGEGLWINHDVGSTTPATGIVWAGAASGTIFEFIPVQGASAQRGTGGGLVDVALFGQNLANNGLTIKSWTNGEFRLYGANFNRTIVECGVVPLLGESRDTQFNQFWIYGRQVTSPVSPSTLIIGGDDNGTSIANTSFNVFHEISTNYKDGIALDLYDSDSNWFGLVRLNSGGGTGKGMVWRGGTGVAGDNPFAARGNYFQMLSVGAGGMEAMGTPTYATASSGAIAWWDGGNGAPNPTVGTGAIVAWSGGGYIHNGVHGFAKMAVSDSNTNATNQRALVGTESLRIHNVSSNHVRLSDGTNEWGIRLNGGNFTITRNTGAGVAIVDTTGIEFQTARVRLKTAVVAGAAGEVILGNGTATTVGAAGGAAAPPATPVGYLVINVGGTNMKVPYYNA